MGNNLYSFRAALEALHSATGMSGRRQAEPTAARLSECHRLRKASSGYSKIVEQETSQTGSGNMAVAQCVISILWLIQHEMTIPWLLAPIYSSYG